MNTQTHVDKMVFGLLHKETEKWSSASCTMRIAQALPYGPAAAGAVAARPSSECKFMNFKAFVRIV